MFKREKMDERQLAQENKVMSGVGRVLLYGLIVMLFVKQWVWKVPREYYMPDFYLLLAASFYAIVRRLILGVGFFGMKNTKVVIPISVILTGMTVTFVSWFTRREMYASQEWWSAVASLGILFVSGAGAAALIYGIIFMLDRSRRRKIDKQLDQDD